MPEKVSSQEGEYEVIHRGECPPDGFMQNYWQRVNRALRDVFDGSEQELQDRQRRAEDLREKVNQQPPDTQTAFYHADPFEVAADLAGRRKQVITPDEKRRYLEVEERSEVLLEVGGALSQTHPEN